MLVPHCTPSTSQASSNQISTGSEVKGGLRFWGALKSLASPCFGRVACVEGMHSNSVQEHHLKKVKTTGGTKTVDEHDTSVQEHNLEKADTPSTESSHTSREIRSYEGLTAFAAIQNNDTDGLEHLLKQGHKPDVVEILMHPHVKIRDLSPIILDLLDQYKALPEGVTLSTLQLVLVGLSNMDVKRTCIFEPDVDVNGVPGMPSPIEMYVRRENADAVKYLIQRGAVDRPFRGCFRGFHKDNYLINSSDIDKSKADLELMFEDRDDEFEIAVAFISSPKSEVYKFIQDCKVYDGESGTHFLGFICWAAKNDRLDLLDNAIFRDLFSFFTYSAKIAASVASAFGNTEFIVTALREGLLQGCDAVKSVGVLAKMGKIDDLKEIMKTHPECVAGHRKDIDRLGTEEKEEIEKTIRAYPKTENAMYWAIKEKKPELIQLLLNAGAHQFCVDFGNKECLLHRAVGSKNSTAIRMFLQAGMDIDHKDRQNETALDCAIQSGFVEGQEILRSWQAKNG